MPGTIWINDWAVFWGEFEDGAFKRSGNGRMDGQTAIDDFLEINHIAFNSGVIAFPAQDRTITRQFYPGQVLIQAAHLRPDNWPLHSQAAFIPAPTALREIQILRTMIKSRGFPTL